LVREKLFIEGMKAASINLNLYRSKWISSHGAERF